MSRVPPWAAFAGCVAIWGASWLAIRAGAAGASPIGNGALRATLAVPLLAALALAVGAARPTWRQMRHALGVGVVFVGANFALVYSAAPLLPTGLASLLYATLPLQAALVGPLLAPGERWRARTLAGAALGLAGIAIAFQGLARLESAYLAPGALVLLGALSSAAGGALARRGAGGGPPMSPFWLNVGVNLSGAATLWALWALLDGRSPFPTGPSGWAGFGYMLVLGSVVGFLLYFELLRAWDTGRAAVATIVAPVLAIAIGALALQERLVATSLLGGALVLAGAWLALGAGRNGRREKQGRGPRSGGEEGGRREAPGDEGARV